MVGIMILCPYLSKLQGSEEVLVSQFLAFKSKEAIEKIMTEESLGSQCDVMSQKDHTCLQQWDDVVEDYSNEHVVSVSNVLQEMQQLACILGVHCKFDCIDIKTYEIKRLVKKMNSHPCFENFTLKVIH